MARFADPDSSRVKIDALVEKWKHRCLVESGSLLFEDRRIWTLGNLEEFHKRFVDDPRLGGGTFGEKLASQLDGAGEDVRWFVAELVAVYFLFARGAINGPSKRVVLEEIVAPLDAEKPSGWQELSDTMDEGIGNPGVGYNINRDLQISYLLDFCLRFKSTADPAGRQALLDNPWALRDFADDASDGISIREMRHILLHLLRPDDFERISSRTHKQNIAGAFAAEMLAAEDAPDDLDEQLLLIRNRLLALGAQPDAHNGVLDFYRPPLHGIWDPGSDRADGASDLDLLEYKKQIVLYGPPGTGKTFRTRQLAGHLVRRAALVKWGASKFFASQEKLDQYVHENIHWVQLHPGYGYEEFIRGLRLGPDGSTIHVNGVLPRLVEKMNEVPEAERLPVILVLDEINRTDLSRLFGEAFSLLENRDTPALLPGLEPGSEPEQLTLPSNLYVIGTMNLIDQSVDELDFALRRRFFWRPAGFDPTPILTVNEERWAQQEPKKWGWARAAGDMALLAERATLLNEQIAASPHLGAQYELGHTYFFDATFFAKKWLRGCKQLTGGVLWTAKGKPRVSIEDLWTFSLEPLLAQYLGGLDELTKVDELARLRRVLMSGKVE